MEYAETDRITDAARTLCSKRSGRGTAGTPRTFTTVLIVIILRHCERLLPYYLMRIVNVSSLRSKILLLLTLGAGLGLAAGKAASQTDLDSLVKNSPFGSSKAGQVADAGNQPIEFRGSMEENGQPIFSLYDTATKRTRWVGLNDTSGEVVVKSFDAEAHTVSVEQNGRPLALTLKSGPRIVQNIPPPMPPAMQPGSPGLPGQNSPNSIGKGPEQQRLSAIADEIRRRRALRSQSPQPMPMPNAVPGSSGPVPMPVSGNSSGGPVPMPNPGNGTNGPMPMPNSPQK